MRGFGIFAAELVLARAAAPAMAVITPFGSLSPVLQSANITFINATNTLSTSNAVRLAQ